MHGPMLRIGSSTGTFLRDGYLVVHSSFCSWSDSQLKAFADKHGIPVPQPRKRDTLLQHIRSNFETVAKTVGDTVSYPGDWIYETWSESGKLAASLEAKLI